MFYPNSNKSADLQTEPSMWLLTEAADLIYKAARNRIYKFTRAPNIHKLPKLPPNTIQITTKDVGLKGGVIRLTMTLEESPKMKLLEVMDQIFLQ